MNTQFGTALIFIIIQLKTAKYHRLCNMFQQQERFDSEGLYYEHKHLVLVVEEQDAEKFAGQGITLSETHKS